ncbi:alpha-amylase family glycosyl hydrolase [Plebeiibacterium sediminum]|uniref:Alpha-amylase family glycosyl hydrolase n=1 Tax=Plebeiibacterium sediminum TaxID=2992112 RepID=A0AAE3M776_9BACT|nr:alpha-amylase family glycosyl hydrolase [Plebeiobacterium sediminum]MCW3788561.1 alpha-amylase family glycosyl hydrolase [Plebeiobacterium sediminum]
MNYSYKIILFLLLFIVIKTPLLEAKNIVERMEPENWWSDLQYKDLMITLKGDNLSQSFIKVNYNGVKFNNLIFTADPNIIILSVDIDKNIQPGKVPIEVYQNGRLQETLYFEINQRDNDHQFARLNESDILYQIIIDRFANGNYDNDKIKDYLEVTNNGDPSGIHGGDIQGIINNTNYLKSIGVTAVELSPLYESNQIFNSYYHDEITNHYEIDKRLGSLSDMQNLSKNFKAEHLKYIQTFTLHKVSKRNWLFKNENIANATFQNKQSPQEQGYAYSLQTDPYSDQATINNQLQNQYSLSTELFNQDIKLVSDYLIQNTIWWIEQTKPDAIKIEDCQLNKLDFLKNLREKLTELYPELGVIYDYNTLNSDELAYWKKQIDGNNIDYIYDYPIAKTLENVFSEFRKPSESTVDLHQAIAKDFNYENPQLNVIFIDNKNTSRAFTLAEKNIKQMKMLATYLLTTRGIPSIFYGTEYLLDGNIMRGDGIAKKNFPGGWQEDLINGFENKNIPYEPSEFNSYIKSLIKYRSDNPILYTGQTQHKIYKDGIYIVLKTSADKLIVIIYNNNTTLQKINILDCYKSTNIYSSAFCPTDNFEFNDLKNVLIEPKTALILELK